MRITLFFLFFFTIQANANDSTLIKMMYNDSIVKNILYKLNDYRVQIIVSNNQNGQWQQTHIGNDSNYYYCASLIKIPLILLTLEKIKSLNKYGVSINSKIIFTDKNCASNKYLNKKVTPTFANYIKQMLLVSDNVAMNVLYDFLGQQYINEFLIKKGYLSTLIIHRFDNCDTIENRITSGYKIYSMKNQLLYEDSGKVNYKQYLNVKKPKVGKGRYDFSNNFFNEPKDFTYNNFISLSDMHTMMKSIFQPSIVADSQKFDIANIDLQWLKNYMKMYPRQSVYPSYNEKIYPDNYGKYYLIKRNSKRFPEYINYYNKNGEAYGFVSDVAYIENKLTGKSFFLSTTIYANSDEVLNDGKYDYQTVAYPFLYQISKVVEKYINSY